MHLVLLSMGLPPLLLDVCPARGVEVPLDARPVCASALLSPLLLRGLRIREQLASSGRLLLAPPLPRLPLPAHHCTLCEVMSRESLRRSAPVRDPPVLSGLRLEKHGRIVEPALGRVALVTGLVALAPLPARGQAVESVVGVTRLDRFLPVRGRGGIDRGLWTAIDPVEFARARFPRRDRSRSSDRYRSRRDRSRRDRSRSEATGRDRSVRDPMFAREVAVTSRSHAISLAALVTVRGHGCGRFSPLTPHGQGIEAGEPGVSCGRVWRLLLSPRLPLSQECRLQWLLLLWGVL